MEWSLEVVIHLSSQYSVFSIKQQAAYNMNIYAFIHMDMDK